MRKTNCLIGILLILCLIFCGCAKVEESTDGVDVDPTQGAANKKENTVLLYFATADYTMLVGEQRIINAPVNQRTEYAILQGLISGPQQNTADFKPLINPNTKVVNVKQTKDGVAVTLSKEFLEWDAIMQESHLSEEKKSEIKQLAVYSIINTLVESQGYPKVQLFVDREGSGTGQRLLRQEAGLEGEEVLEPMEHKGEICRTAVFVLESALESYKNKDYTVLYSLVSFTNDLGEETAFRTSLEEKNISIGTYKIAEVLEGTNAERCTIIASFSMVKNDETINKTNIPFVLVKVNGIWKVTQQSIALITE